MSNEHFGSGVPGPRDPRRPDDPLRALDEEMRGLDEELRGLGASGTSAGGGGDAGPPSASATGEEAALRRILHSAVGELEPAPDALERLQYAVPARRARKRQLAVGAAALVVLIGAAVPTLIGSGVIDGPSGSKPQAGGSHEPGGSTPGNGGGGEPGKSPGSGDASQSSNGKDKESQKPGGTGGAGESGSSDDSTVAAPGCVAGQLGAAQASSGQPDAKGRITGSFTMKNISQSSCAVSDPGDVNVDTDGEVSTASVAVAPHEPGDPAADLLPASSGKPVVLAAGESYVVRFAFVPAVDRDAGCKSGSTPSPATTEEPKTTAEGVPQADPDGEGAVGETDGGPTGATGSTGDGSTGGTGGDGTEGGELTLTNTPEPGGDTTATTTVPDVCGGTVYYTDALPVS
ncbi:hypothetical protein G5C51_25425 [Streptomyces sp. A7024]|uniref:DUF4232 domain-containing protein n=1 Tax=Streptomyces coryli TaxID=1128680 RepID=A0A6G4U4Y1_9ACTN|nr:hypothetical protein [Streptomyces coryli]NGN67234.1 hypothetical protein [Streptomyces coryli]